MIFQLKTWPTYFEKSWAGTMPFQLRHRGKDEEKFNVWDVLRLREYVPEKKMYTGREICVEIIELWEGPDFMNEDYIGMWGLASEWSLMTVREISREGD